jgi:glycosyltransferase involved in cell wall biosynthesis/SAM-dependent methyltransferase
VDRAELIRHPFNQSMQLIEVGASYSPIIPKRDGWQTSIIDHATQAELRIKYAGETPDRIEPVDYVWHSQSLDHLIPVERHGTFDGLIASHVGEHIPDPIGFFKAVDKLLKPSGVIALALPDKRACFDFFQPHSTTGDLLEAHQQGRARHRPSKIFDGVAYYTTRNRAGGWAFGLPSDQHEPVVSQSLHDAYQALLSAPTHTSQDYQDTHGWQFTPGSFQLIILELHHLGIIPWTISRIESALGVEFYVWLERRSVKYNGTELQARRTALLRQTAIEIATEQLKQLTERSTSPQIIDVPAVTKAKVVPPRKTISAIIPLYNGAKFIGRSLESVLAQTEPPMEIIVVDDGSRDNGAEVVKDYQVRNPAANIILLQKPNGGQSSARNFGASHARGDLLAFLDQDDLWYAAHIERLSRPFYKQPPGSPLGWVYSNLDEADVDGHVVHTNWLTMASHTAEHPKTVLYNCMNQDMFVLPSAALIAREVFEAVGGYDERLSGYEDDDLFLRIFHAGYQNKFLNIPLSKWCIHHQSSSFTPRMRQSRVIYSHKLLETFKDDPKRNVYFSRDIILPRFYRHAVIEFRQALENNDLETVTETLDEIRYLLKVARLGDGIDGMMDKHKAKRLERLFRRLSPRTALRVHRARRTVGPLRHPVSRMLRKFLPVYG